MKNNEAIVLGITGVLLGDYIGRKRIGKKYRERATQQDKVISLLTLSNQNLVWFIKAAPYLTGDELMEQVDENNSFIDIVKEL